MYPGDFSTSSRVVSTLASSILEVIGDCETSFSCDSRRRLEHDDETALLSDYSYSYSYALPNCADYSDERWIEDSCTGDYHYADATCDYACLLTEGLYWALTSHLGAQAGRCDDIADEWELCTDALIQANAPMLAQLLNHSTLPTVIPDGDYDWDTYYAVHTDDAIDYVCADSETWHKKGDTNKGERITRISTLPLAAGSLFDAHTHHATLFVFNMFFLTGCAWVAALPESRCTVKDEFAVYGFERCSETCGACGVACVDSETWYKKGEPTKNCDYWQRPTLIVFEDRPQSSNTSRWSLAVFHKTLATRPNLRDWKHETEMRFSIILKQAIGSRGFRSEPPSSATMIRSATIVARAPPTSASPTSTPPTRAPTRPAGTKMATPAKVSFFRIISPLSLLPCFLSAPRCARVLSRGQWFLNVITDCTWVAGFPESRCTVKNEFVVFAFEECSATCSTCTGACEDSTSWFKKGEPAKDCTWASRFANRFYVVGDDDTMAYESCHYAARSCDF